MMITIKLTFFMIRTIINFTILYLLLVSHTQAQQTSNEMIDSLMVHTKMQRSVRSCYVRPLFEISQGSTQVYGDERFSEPHNEMMRQFTVGVRLGYRSEILEIETGLSSVRIGAGYKFIPEYDNGLISSKRSSSYTHIPLTIRYRVWQPTQWLSFRAGVGFAYNVDLNKVKLASKSIYGETFYKPDGSSINVGRRTSIYGQTLSFLSGEVNLSAFYQLSTRFGVMLEAKRLISSKNVVRLDVVREMYNPAELQKFYAVGGANGYNISFGVSYQFGFNNRYKLKDG